MKVAYGELGRTEETQGVQRSKTFQIRTNGHAFRMLSSGLYSDKITAVLREIGCNANDAHIAAGQKKPFLVKLPTRLDNQFYIKDWGIGMDADEVENLYSTYFASSKQDSNDFTGAFGLGSKSPFSYTDAFMVTAVKDGVKRVYGLHVDKVGAPVVSLMHEGNADSDWQSGVQVGFQVKPEDFEDFRKKAERVFRVFSTPPEVQGIKLKPLEFSEDLGKYAMLTDNCVNELSGSTYHYQTDLNFVLMGSVLYPMKIAQIATISGPNGRFVSAARNMSGLMLRVPIGSVQVAGSREELQYDDDTKKYLASVVAEIPKKALEKLIDDYRKVKTFKDAFTFRTKAEGLTSNLRFDEQMLMDCGATKTEADDIGTAAHHGAMWQMPMWDCEKQGSVIRFMESKGSTEFRLKIDTANMSYRNYIRPTLDTKLVVGDCLNPYGRARLAIKTDKLATCFLVTRHKDATDDTGVNKAVDVLQKLFKDMEVVKTSDLDRPAKLKKVAARANELVRIDGSNVKIDDVDAARRFYVKVKRRSSWGNMRTDYLMKAGEIDRYSLWELKQNLDIMESIIGKYVWPLEFTERQIKRYGLADDTTWMEWEDYIKEKLEDTKAKDKLKDLLSKNKLTVDLHYGGQYARDMLTMLCCFKKEQPAHFKVIEPVLKSHGILSTIETVYNDSMAKASGKNTVYSATQIADIFSKYAELCTKFGANATVPQAPKASAVNVFAKYTKAAKLGWSTFMTLCQIDPEYLKHVLDSELKKG